MLYRGVVVEVSIEWIFPCSPDNFWDFHRKSRCYNQNQVVPNGKIVVVNISKALHKIKMFRPSDTSDKPDEIKDKTKEFLT